MINSQKWFNRALLLHVACWGLYISYELSLIKFSFGKLEPLYVYTLYYATNILLFYGVLWIINYPLKNRSWRFLKYFMLVVYLLTIFFFLKVLVSYLSYGQSSINLIIKDPVKFFLGNLYRGSIFAFLALFYYLSAHLATYKRKSLEAEKAQLIILNEKVELEKRLIISQNAYLQQQLNPHLLFNALNFVYSRVFLHSADGGRAIELLSDILRYCLDEGDADGKTALEVEIQQVKNLIEINNFRFENALQLHTAFHGDFINSRIIPLILLTLTENIFKHGNLRDPEHPAILKIEITPENELRYYSRNLKIAQSGAKRLRSIGLKNIRVRLDYAYPNKYHLATYDSDDFFELTLKLAL